MITNRKRKLLINFNEYLDKSTRTGPRGRGRTRAGERGLAGDDQEATGAVRAAAGEDHPWFGKVSVPRRSISTPPRAAFLHGRDVPATVDLNQIFGF